MGAPLERSTFARFVQEALSRHGAEVTELPQAPHAERVVGGEAGWSLGLRVELGGQRAQVGIWYRVENTGARSDLTPLLRFYRHGLEGQGLLVHVLSMVTELGSFSVLLDSEEPLPPEQAPAWIQFAEGVADACFPEPAFTAYLVPYRHPEPAAPAAEAPR